MSYCKSSDVRLIVSTDLEDHEIDDLIPLADSDLDDLLQGASMTDIQKKNCSMRLTAIMIANRIPRKESIAGIVTDWTDQIATWQAYVDEKVGLAAAGGAVQGKVVSSSYSTITDDD